MDVPAIVIGGFNTYGQLITHIYYLHDDYSSSNNLAHTPEEKASGATFRWNIKHQYYESHFISQRRDMTDEERMILQDWLIANGYADEDRFDVKK